MWLFLGSGFSGGKVCSLTAGRYEANETEAESSGVVNRDSRVTGACLICTCVAVKVIEFQAVVFLCWQRTVERFTEDSDE